MPPAQPLHVWPEMLNDCRNRELNKALGSMRMVEDRFNRNFKYPWTFMNDRPFTDEVAPRTPPHPARSHHPHGQRPGWH